MRATFLKTTLLAAGFGLVTPVAWSAAGKVLFVSGVGRIHGADERTLHKGDEVDVGNVVSTDAGGRLQLLMADGARIVLQPGSSVRIDEFAMPSVVTDPGRTGEGGSPGKSVATLLAGRIDASAGAIGTITIHAHGEPIVLT